MAVEEGIVSKEIRRQIDADPQLQKAEAVQRQLNFVQLEIRRLKKAEKALKAEIISISENPSTE